MRRQTRAALAHILGGFALLAIGAGLAFATLAPRHFAPYAAGIIVAGMALGIAAMVLGHW